MDPSCPHPKNAAMTVPLEELRLALVLNGGVSLAVWMGGTAREIDALVRATLTGDNGAPTGPYAPVLEMARTWTSVDVISGTSAGGINGACLALSMVNANARLGALRDLWAEQGRFDNLLRPPFKGQPTSLLRGDEYFLPELTRAMRGLTTDFKATNASVDLIITTTLLGGSLTVTTDGLGQLLPQRRHGAHFNFTTHDKRDKRNDFTEQQVVPTSAALGLAARCTAGFPFAFEPTFVPVVSPVRGTEEPEDTEIGGRPNMWQWASWAGRSRTAPEYPEKAEDLSRYAVDGGLLANTPTREALDAIDRRPAGSPLRRVMMLVFPHAPAYDPADADADPADEVADVPTVTNAVSGLLSSLTSQGSLTFVEEIEQHNRRASQWRGGRRQVLESFRLEHIYGLVDNGWPFYGSTRVNAAARHLSERVRRPDGWDYSRVVHAARAGQERWTGPGRALPYVPKQPPLDSPPDPGAPTRWDWGTTVALGIADSAAEILLLAQGVAPEEQSTVLAGALMRVSDARDRMLDARDSFDDWWWHQPALAPVAPDAAYWALRLDCYHVAMQGAGGNGVLPADWLETAARKLHGLDGQSLPDKQKTALIEALEKRERLQLGSTGTTPGAQTVVAVWDAVAALADVAGTVLALTSRRGPLATWRPVLEDAPLADESADPTHRLLVRLLTLDAATWMLADAESPGTSQEIKLAQLSLAMDHPFAEATKTPDDKVAGSELNRFGGFLKRSWRINDWIWGRLDAAQMLCRLVLDPRRLLRIKEMTDLKSDELIDQLLRATYGEPKAPSSMRDLEEAARKELRGLFNGQQEDRGYLPALAALAAHPIQQRIIVSELPALAAAIETDALTGGNKRCRGMVFVEAEKQLLSALSTGGDTLWLERGDQALAAFDRAGVGREPLQEEARSDAMIQTAVTTAATLVTVADSGRFGVKAARPLTKAVRGAALVPYWLVTGLLSGSGTVRALALLGFAVGGVTLLLSLFGVLGAFSSAGATVGAGVVVGALGFAALRSGTLLHGAALLGVAVPLVMLAVPALPEGTDDGDVTRSSISLATVAVVVLGLIVLASLPNPIRSPLAALLAPRLWLVKLVSALLVVAGVVAVIWFRPQTPWKSWYDEVSVESAIAVTATVAAVGVLSGWLRGRGMRRWTRHPVDGWQLEKRVSVPSGVSAGWASVYGGCYLGLAWGAAAWMSDRAPHGAFAEAPTWQLVAMTWWAVLGVVLSLAGPFWITWRARRALGRIIRREGGKVRSEVSDDDFRDELERRGRLYSCMVSGHRPPRLNYRAVRLKPAVVERENEEAQPGPA